MFIKELVLSGFLSFGKETRINDLSKGLNLVVGRNGTGKSNFFVAIRFLLSELPAELANRDLVHLGVSASQEEMLDDSYVEVCFDNSDRRFVGVGSEVRIRRTLTRGSLTASEYTLDGASVTKQEVLAKLESAGFSPAASAFYIVPQGEVAHLATATDTERMETLRAVSGIDVFESRRDSSRQLLLETRDKMDATQEYLDHIETRLRTLEAEREELQTYLKAQTDRRSIEYVLLKRETERVENLLEEIGLQRQAAEAEHEKIVAELTKSEERVERAQTAVTDSQAEVALAEAEVEANERELTRIQGQNTRFSAVDDDELMEVEPELADTQTETGLDVDELRELVPELERRNESAREAIVAAESRVEPLRAKVRDAQANLQSLQARQGRFASMQESEREEAASKAKRDVENALKMHRDILETQKALVTAAEESQRATEREMSDAEAIAGSTNEAVSRATERERAERTRLENAETERSRVLLSHRKGEVLAERHVKAAEQAAKLLTDTGASSEVVRGITTVQSLVQEIGLSAKYFGVLAEVVEIEPAGAVAIETAAGNALFYHVTADAETANALINAMAGRNLGVATFMPLSDLSYPSYDAVNIEDAVPLTNFVHATTPEVQPAVEMAWGRYILAKDSATAASVTERTNRPSITPEGDLLEPRGSITGGYIPHGQGQSRFQLIKKAFREARAAQSVAMTEEDRQREVAAANAAVTAAHNAVSSAEIEKERCIASRASASSTVLRLKSQLARYRSQIEEAQDTIKTVNETISSLQSEHVAIEGEYLRPLSGDEQTEIKELLHYVDEVSRQLREQSTQLEELYAEEQSTQQELRMRRSQLAAALRRQELRAQLDEEAEERASRNSELDQRAKAATRQLQESKRRLKSVTRAAESREEDLESAISARQNAAVAVVRHERVIEKRNLRRKTLLELKKDNDVRMRSIGQVTQAALNGELDELSTEQLETQFAELSATLDSANAVNKKAADQYETYQRELQMLKERFATLERERTSIVEVIAELDLQKDKRLTEMLKRFSKEFSNVFSELTDGHTGQLRFSPSITKPERMSFDVSFGTNNQLLSGGQTTLCALALIFAIQRSDPAPFYIFDEVDANLDTQHRSAVARSLRKASKHAQFICTTFRPELVEVANQWFGVSLEKRASAIEPISKELALQFVSDE